MRKVLRLLLAILIIILLALAILAVRNMVLNKKDARIIQGAYGQKVQLADGREMNICIYGSGEKNLVILPGFGTVSPAYEYKGLSSKLKGYKVIVIEPFGYGLSDNTTTERTSEAICSEVHEAINTLGIGKYTLAAHSLSGIYAMNYVEAYSDEVERFIGIDISVPGEADSEAANMVPALKVNMALRNLGVLRLLMSHSGDNEVIIPGILQNLDESEIDVYRKIIYTNSPNKTLINEASNIPQSLINAEGYKFPKNLPVDLYVSKENCDTTPNWYEDHMELISGCENAECEIMDGGHYLHLDCAEELAEKIMH